MADSRPSVSTLDEIAFVDLYLEAVPSACRIRSVADRRGLEALPESVYNDLRRLYDVVVSHARSAADPSHFSVPYNDTLYRVQAINDVRGTVYALRRGLKRIPDLSTCGIAQPVLDFLMGERAGLILFAGGFGSGKTTAASAFVRAMTFRGAMSITLEDPPELPLSGDHGLGRCLQVQVNRKHVDSAVEETMRMAFDLLFVSEIRSPSVAAEVIKASINGKLIISTMHADAAVSAVSRIISLAAESGSGFSEKAARETLASGLAGVVYMCRLPGNRCAATEYLIGGPETSGKIMSGEYKGLQNVVNNIRNRLNNNMPLFGG